MPVETFLSQWADRDIPAAQGPAKQHEFAVYVPPLMDLLADVDAQRIIDFQADEGVVSVAFCLMDSFNRSTFVTIPEPALIDMAEKVTAGQSKIRLVASLNEINSHSADAILFNNILGCQGALENIDDILSQATPKLYEGGYAIVTVPNPDGGDFSTYSCSALPPAREHGGTYDFQMKGESEKFVNLYLTESGLTETFARHGFGLVEKRDVADLPYPDDGVVGTAPAFRQYLFQLEL